MGHLIINFVGGNYVDLPYTQADAEAVIQRWYKNTTHDFWLTSTFAFRGHQVTYITWKAS